MTNHLGLVPSFSCFLFVLFFGTRHLLLSAYSAVQERGVAGGTNGVFQTCNRIHSDHLPDVDSPECWGMVSCNW